MSIRQSGIRAGKSRSAFSRRGLLGLIAGAGAGAGVGCARNYRQVDSTIPDRYRNRLRVVAWHTFGGSNGEALAGMVKAFNESQSEIYVDAQYQGGYDESQQKLSMAIIGRQIPDLSVFSEVTWRQMHLADALEPLEEYFDSELRPGNYVEQFITEGTVKDHIWWLPFARSTPLFYFNKSVFKSAGLPQRAPKTWDEFRQWTPEIKKIKANGQQVMPLALHNTDADWHFQCNMWQWKANYSHDLDITLDRPRGIEAASWINRLIHEDKAAYLSANGDVDFGNQAAAAYTQSTAALAQLTELAKESKFEVGTGFLPEHDAFGCSTGGSGWSILAKAPRERKEASFEFLKFLAKPENAATWTIKTGYLPSVNKAEQDPRLIKLMSKDPNFGTSLKQLSKTKTQDLARLVVPNANVFMNDALESLYTSNISPRNSFGQLAGKLRRKADLIEENYRAHYE